MKEVNELIRGELAAIKSIDTVLSKVNDEIEKSELSTIRQDHVKAADKLKQFIKGEVGDSVVTGGPWTSFASAFTGGASLFGDKSALRALKVGEEHGISEYREALQEEGMDSALKDVIRSELLPQQEKHLSMINKYLQ